MPRGDAGETLKRVRQRRRRARIRGNKIDRVVPQLLQPEVGAGVESDDIHPLFDHTDERQEERAIETILVEAGPAAHWMSRR